ncbi:MAG TPA: SDR family oxidoreductase [Candidatus Methylacidiphilales bacterium]|jgi:3-oxoacyl-[acyl-carrier protein] reductase|nr:SDR family oxidoreductase [Candidatus Methylacidiphilales bacterium]
MADPLHVVITGGGGDLARAIVAALPGDAVHAPPRAELDVRDEAQVDAFFAKLPRVDVLIANAGLTRDGALANLSTADIDEVIAANLRGAFLCTRAAIKPMMKQRGGHILLIGSRAGKHGTRGQSAYAAAKAGLVGFGQSVAKEYGSRNVRCNIVLPGFLQTKFTAHLPEKRLEQIREEHVLERFNTPENAARAIAFLARLDHVSGQVFTLDSRMDRWT